MANPPTAVVRRTTQAVDLARITGSPVWVDSPLRVNALSVYWVAQAVGGKTLDGHNVYRHITPQFGPGDLGVVKLNTTLIQVPLFKDVSLDMSRKQQFYYLVTQHFTDNAEIPLAKPVSLGSPESNAGVKRKNISSPRIYEEWRRRKRIIIHQTGEMVAVLVQRTSGPRCECFDPKYEHTTYGNCPLCYGTGFERGYELIPDVLVRVLNSREILKLQPAGLQLSSNPKGWIIDFPLLRNGDAIVRRDGLRYEVDSTDFTVHSGILTEENFELVALPQNHPIYSFPVLPLV